ncbi:MAG: hypothetical protein QNI86_07595 [Halieaceae bacterium]|nr:hypothetical protein [Halieaceae bacterium]
MSQLQNHSAPAASPALPTRSVMIRVILAGMLFAGAIIRASFDTPQLATTGFSGDQVYLDLRDARPSRAIAWQREFVPAAANPEKRVLKKLASLEAQWQERGIKVAVAAVEQDPAAEAFAEQLDGWFRARKMTPDTLPEPQPGRAQSPQGFTIRCHEYQRAEARELLLALSPLMRGSMAIEFSQRAEPGQMAIYIDGVPSFNKAGVAFFPSLKVEA